MDIYPGKLNCKPEGIKFLTTHHLQIHVWKVSKWECKQCDNCQCTRNTKGCSNLYFVKYECVCIIGKIRLWPCKTEIFSTNPINNLCIALIYSIGRLYTYMSYVSYLSVSHPTEMCLVQFWQFSSIILSLRKNMI